MGRITSDVGAAQQAIAAFNSFDVGYIQTVNFSQSNISGMHAGREVANQVLNDLEGLFSCIKTQAGKFEQLASFREELDAADREIFKK